MTNKGDPNEKMPIACGQTVVNAGKGAHFSSSIVNQWFTIGLVHDMSNGSVVSILW
jgi:hypothetical protein